MIKNDYILFKYSPNKSKIEGMFDEEDGNIYVDADLPDCGRKLVYAHESQHRTCFYNKCTCYKSGSLFRIEYHAFLAELIFVVKENKDGLWKYYFKGIQKELIKFNNPSIEGWIAHFKALRKVCKLKVFIQNAKKYRCWKTIEKRLREN